MAVKYVYDDNGGIGTGSLTFGFGQLAKGQILDDGPIEQMMMDAEFGVSPDGTGPIANAYDFRVGFKKDGRFAWIGGAFMVSGYRDGPGNQALFALGSSYPVANAQMDSKGAIYISDGGNSAVRKGVLTAGAAWDNAANWTWSTLLKGEAGIGLIIDSNDNLWTQSARTGEIIKATIDGQILNRYSALRYDGDGAVQWWSQGRDDQGNIYIGDNMNSATVVYRLRTDGVLEHVSGISDGVNYKLYESQALPTPMFGDKDHSFYFHSSVTGVSPDGKEVFSSGGDTLFICRTRPEDGQSEFLAADGFWKQIPYRGVDYDEVMQWVCGGVDFTDKSIFVCQASWQAAQAATWRYFKKLKVVDTTDTPTPILALLFTDTNKNEIPTSMEVGKTYDFRFAIANNGTVPWTSSDTSLSPDGASFGAPILKLNDGEVINPGDIREFKFSVTPTVPEQSNLKYWLTWKWQTPEQKFINIGFWPYTFTVVGAGQPLPTPGGTMNSSFVSQNIPASMIAGQTYDVSVTFTNTGTETWSEATDYRAGVQKPAQDSTAFGPNRLKLDAGISVAPGAQGVFKGTLTAPNAGNYSLQFQMVRDFVSWFGPMTPPISVAVAAVAPPPPPPPVVAIPPGTYNFTGTLTSPDGTTNGTITASIVVSNPQPVPGTVTLTFTKL